METPLLEGLLKLGLTGILAAVLWIVTKLYYSDLKTRIAQMDAKIQQLEARCDQLEAKNATLEQENGRLKAHEDQLKTCPLPNCHWRQIQWPQQPA